MRRFRGFSGSSFPFIRPWKVDGKVNEQRFSLKFEKFFFWCFIELCHVMYCAGQFLSDTFAI